MPLTQVAVQDCLKSWVDPNLGTDLVSARMVKKIEAEDGRVHIRILMGYPAASFHAVMKAALIEKIKADTEAREVQVDIETDIVSHAVQKNLKPMAGVKNIIAVSSGKGGVGKSTTAANIALALSAEGAKVGVLDADIYGPSQPLLLGVEGRPDVEDGNKLVPMTAHGLQVMSIGFLITEDTPMVWRGPMVTGALQQLLRDTKWRDLDYLIIDLPPGTGDIQLTLSQQIPVSGALIVTTPQDIALLDAQKGLKMFEKVGVAVLGIVENMSMHVCSNCGHAEPIFGSGGGERMAEKYAVELLGSLPLDIHIREHADSGRPTVIADPHGPAAEIYRSVARKTAARLALRAKDYSSRFPTIAVVND